MNYSRAWKSRKDLEVKTKLKKQHEKQLSDLIEQFCAEKHILQNNQTLSVLLTITTHPKVDIGVRAAIDELLAGPINSEKLCTRSRNFFFNEDIKFLGQLARMSPERFLNYRNVGKRSLDEVKDYLAELGLTMNLQVPMGPLERQQWLSAPPWILCSHSQYLDARALSAVGNSVQEIKESRREDFTAKALLYYKEKGQAEHVARDNANWLFRNTQSAINELGL